MDWGSFFSALLGGAIAIGGQLMVHHIKSKPQRELDKKRKETLKILLDPQNPAMGKSGWRKFETLQRVVGASEEDTKRLLVEIEARGNTKGADVWALIKDKPLPTKPEDE